MSKPKKKTKVRRQQVFEASFTKLELLHLRDVMSVLLPPSGEKTMSQALAELEDRSMIESMLWSKLTKLCAQAKLPLEGEAPDYVIAPTAAPPMGVFHINHDMEAPTSATTTVFDEQEEESGETEDEEAEEDE